jgi:hypothetical protein
MEYADIYHGVFLIRGENVVLVGEINEEEEEEERSMEMENEDAEKEVDGDEEQVKKQQAVVNDQKPVMSAPAGYTLISDPSVAQRKWESERLLKKKSEKARNSALARLGFSIEVIEGDLY